MKKVKLIAVFMLILVCGLSNFVFADATKTVGTEGDYTTLRAAFTSINNGSITGAITLQLISNITETASAVLNASGSGSASYTSINIYPTTTGLSISGNLAAPLIDLNGADNVTIDGRVNACGSAVSLVISNTSTSNSNNTSTIRFTNDATLNTIKYCKLQGSTTTQYDGILSFKNTATTTGNSNNTIDHNEITNAGGNRPRNALFSCGFSEAVMNSSNIVTNNNFYDVLNLNQNWTRAIVISAREDAHPNNSYSTGWTISGNSFYDTQDFTSSITGSACAIYVWADHGSGFTISNNYIGGSAALCSGTWTKSTGNIFFTAIFLNAKQAGATNYIQGNSIKNFNYTNSGNYGWYGINFNSGDNNVSDNSIGSSTGTGSIIFTTGSSDGNFVGIYQGVYCSSTVNNNTIGAITVANSNQAYASNFTGIWVSSYCGSGSTSNNMVGSTTTSNSINATSASTSNAQTVVGIKIQGGSTMNISNNTIANLTNGTTNETTSSQGYIYGIYPFQAVNTITGNTIHDLTIANANNGTGPVISSGNPSTSLSAGGIVAPIYNGSKQTIAGNTVFNISNSRSDFTGHLAGIYHYGQSFGSSVNGNLIYGLSVSSSSSSASIHGIKIGQGTTTYSNNIIVLGGNTTTNLYGIYESGASSTTSNIYFNTVYLNGAPTSGSLNSACLYNPANSSIRNFRNNIFNNARSNSGASGTHYAVYVANTGGSLTCDYNDYYISGTGGALGYYGSAKTSLPIVTGVTGNDANSKALLPGFANPGETNADSYIPSANLPALAGTGVLTDYDSTVRSLTIPAMGAHEITIVAPVTVNASSGTATSDYMTLKLAFDAINAGTHKGTITVTINTSTTEASSAVLNASGSGSASYTSINIYPTSTGLSISGNLSAPLIELNGADNVTIDGRVNATGTTKDLTISHPSTSQPTIRFINDACSNVIRYATVKGANQYISNTYSQIGVINFATAISTGNDNNTIEYSDVRDADGNSPIALIVSYGTSGKENSGDTISNCNLYNFIASGTSTSTTAIMLYNYNASWSITGNSIFQTSGLTLTSAISYSGIWIPGIASDITIEGNYIGGSGCNCSGTWAMSGSSSIFRGIHFNPSTHTGTSSIQNNIVKNISITGNGATTPFYGMYINATAGIVNIGTTTGNIIGCGTGNGSISIESTANATSYGIYTSGTAQMTLSNNTIGSLTTSATTTLGSSITAIHISGNASTRTMSNNNIGSATSANSISALTSTSGSQIVRGIYVSGAAGTIFSISGNLISNLTNESTNTSGSDHGIYALTGIHSITGNTIRNMTTKVQNLYGIYLSSTATGHTVSNNAVYSMYNENSSGANVVRGLSYTGPSTGAQVMERNLVHNLSISTSNSSAIVNGIYFNGKLTCKNNMVQVGVADGAGLMTGYNIIGIYDDNGDSDIYFNSVYVGGSDVEGSNSSNAYFRNGTSRTSVQSIKNNIFMNARSNGSGNGAHYAMLLQSTIGVTSDYNDLYVSGTGGKVGGIGSPATDYTNLADWQTGSSQDAHSSGNDPYFTAPAADTAGINLHITSGYSAASLSATPVTGVNNDIDDDDRCESTPCATNPCIGADEFTPQIQVPLMTTVVASSISATYTTGNGTITNTGGENATNRGVIRYLYTDSDKIIGNEGVTNVSETGSYGIGSFTASLTGLSVNTRYNARAHATNTLGTGYGTRVDFWTLANVPAAPTVNNATSTTLDVAINVNSNPAGTEFAIQETSGNRYVQANGTLGASAVWQTNSSWGTKTVTGLTSGTGYTFKVKARNGANTETSFSSTTSLSTKTPGLWTGATSTDWHTATNWDDGVVPTSTVDVTIPNVTNKPVIGGIAVCRNLTVQSSSSLTIQASYTLNIKGNMIIENSSIFTNSGTLKFSGTNCYLQDNRSSKTTLGNIIVED